MTAASHKPKGVKIPESIYDWPTPSFFTYPYINKASMFSGKIVSLTDIGAGDVPARVEIDPDELSLRENRTATS